MYKVDMIVFRKLTDADFFNINKLPGTESGGGGQSYIDLPLRAVSLGNWRDFFRGIKEEKGNNGPIWTVKVKSLGVAGKEPQNLTIAQRRRASVSIRSQKLMSRNSNRVWAWHPDHTGFPKPSNPRIREHIYDLHIYLLRLENGEFWAGWFQRSKPKPDWPIDNNLNLLFTESEGCIKFPGYIFFDINDSEWPFRVEESPFTKVAESSSHIDNEEKQTDIMFDDDVDISSNAPSNTKEVVRRIRIRNTKAVRDLKTLYNGLCQVTGEKYTFKKADGKYYSEAHHLIPLGRGGADSVYNIVVISPLIHRMLHYASVEGLDISKISENKLRIKINGENYTITWHPEHAKTVERHSD